MDFKIFAPEKAPDPLIGFVQDALRRADLYDGLINDRYDAQTAEAVRAFQTRAGLTPDGVIGARTWAALTPLLTGNYSYAVRAGDTLSKIAEAAGITTASLQAANPLADPKNLFVGQRLLVPFVPFIVPVNVRYSSQILALNLSALRARYPFLQRGKAGRSALGRPLPYLRFGNGKKAVFYSAAHHANEWITSVLLVKFIEAFCYAYVNGEKIGAFDPRRIFETSSIYVLPMVNPDGVDLCTGALHAGDAPYESAAAIAREYPQIPFPSGWKANIAGTDLNLNYPAGWAQAQANKAALGYVSPAPRDYVGPYPFSAPESRAVAQLTLNILPRLVLAYHAQGEVIYWKYADYDPMRAYEIAREFSRLSGYPAEITPEASAYAGYKDWFIQHFDLPGYTVEVGRGASPLPLEQFPKIYEDNIGILLSAPTLA